MKPNDVDKVGIDKVAKSITPKQPWCVVALFTIIAILLIV